MLHTFYIIFVISTTSC